MNDKNNAVRKVLGVRHKANQAQVRLNKDLDEAVSEGIKLSFPEANNIQKFIVLIQPATGHWRAGKFEFEFTIPDDWPITKPDIKILTRVWHPNIDENGAVCLSILRDNYLATLSISQFVAGLQYLFIEPNPNSPLNTEAATMFKNEPAKFQETVDDYIEKYCPK
ncbi:E2 ubiquitin-conjugating enzyme, putative [Trichomonas vaginalis G3]|uniref:E2 NEDD8-conjugating enzyme n=1 Tax=Trichomonas vaginalis (strain ATCC PRA-98 / G3) TaxID=412133 RepID=A2DXW4_TRIV3|nr:NEDD8 transferase protein [Trichomonas vaginalis G3]EAY14700.1 E2 ubiquitin-conjugating enzyme, putative [Trichomonas vaginalis G3]KAI5487928.1 NEDD8 transferase protein [Trichomonas vaginalis G3]|eukprot:XP_001326923.1 E2 ubiquitin-conjugating enzyme [Trichomonas vaginalis G3]